MGRTEHPATDLTMVSDKDLWAARDQHITAWGEVTTPDEERAARDDFRRIHWELCRRRRPDDPNTPKEEQLV